MPTNTINVLTVTDEKLAVKPDLFIMYLLFDNCPSYCLRVGYADGSSESLIYTSYDNLMASNPDITSIEIEGTYHGQYGSIYIELNKQATFYFDDINTSNEFYKAILKGEL